MTAAHAHTPQQQGHRALRSRYQLHLGLAALLAAVSLGVARLAMTGSSLEFGIAAVLIAAAAAASAVTGASFSSRCGLFLPLTFIGLWAIGFGLASIVWKNPNDKILALSSELRPESVPAGLAVAAVGLLAWAGGYCFLRLRLLRAALTAIRRWGVGGSESLGGTSFALGRVMAVYGVGIGARLMLLALGRYSYITSDLQGSLTQSSPVASLLGQLDVFTGVALLVLSYVAFTTRSKASWGLLVLVLLIEIPFGLLSGLRSFILLRLLGVAVTYFLVRRRVPVLAVFALLAVLTFVSPFTDAYRAEVRGSEGTTVTAGGAADLIPTLFERTLASVSAEDIATAPASFAAQRLRFVDEVAIVHQKVPAEVAQIPATDTVVEAATVLVPRSAWKGKPVYTLGLEYARSFWAQPDSVVSARSPTYPGEAFYRGRWLGLVVLMALVGALMAALNMSLSPKVYPAALPLFLAAWIQVLNVETSLVLLGAGLAQSILVTAVALRWVSRARRGSASLTTAQLGVA